MKYQAVLFDFDYTLGDATASIYEGYCHGFEKMGYPKPDLEAVRRTVGYIRPPRRIPKVVSIQGGGHPGRENRALPRRGRASFLPSRPGL